MNEIYIALPFLQFVVSLFLASIVMFSDPKSRRNRLFVLFLVALALWGLTIFGMRDSFPDSAVAYSWEKAALAVIPFSGIFFYHFVFAYTRVRGRLWLLACIYGLGAVSAVLSLTGQSATGMVERFYGFAPQLGWAFPIVLCAAYPPVVLGMYELTRELRSITDAGERARLHALRLGGLVSVLGGTSDFAPSLGLNVYPLGVVGNLLFAVIATWSVTQHRLMNLRLALRGGVAHTVMSSFVFGVYAAVYGPVWLLARNLSLTAIAIVAVGTVILVGVFVRPLVTRAESLVDKVFFRERFGRLQALGQLNEVSRDIRDLNALAASLVDTIRRAAQTDWATIMLPDQPGQCLVVAAESGIPKSGRTLRYDGCVASWLLQHKAALRARDFFSDALLQAMSDEERAALEANGTTIVIPLIVEDSLTGLIALGPKLVGGDYSGEDVGFLVTAADQVAMALQSAKLYADAQRVARERTALAEERTALAELSRVVSSTLDLDSVFERCEEQVCRLISYDRFVITTVDTDQGLVMNSFVRGIGVPGWEQGQTHALSGSPFETVIGTATGLIVPSEPVPSEAVAHPERAASAVAGLRSTLATPLLSNGRVIGTMNLESKLPNAYSPQDLALAERVGAQIANTIANSQHYEQAIQLAEEREARIRLDAENRELQRADEERSALISTVSHELKTPLTSLSAFTDILLRNRDRNLTPRQMQQLEVIQRGGRSLNVLINDLLDISRIDSGNLKIDAAEFDARELVEQVDESFAPILAVKSQALEITLPAEPFSVTADRERLRQVVTNLLSNASKYSGEGASIQLEVWGEEDRLNFKVRDHGIGISKEDQKRLFQAFFRADNDATLSAGGTGLGLVIAKGLVELHGGRISVEREPRMGTTVTFHIRGLSQARAGIDSPTLLSDRRSA